MELSGQLHLNPREIAQNKYPFLSKITHKILACAVFLF
jgi:hypothetical protein